MLISPLPYLLPFQLFFKSREQVGSQTGPDPENRVGDQDTGSPDRPVSSGLQVPVSRFLPGRAKDLSAYYTRKILY
jgi:hypothetical protein